MALTINYDISLDLVRNNYVAIRIKQYDKNSRKVIIHITDNGKEFKLDDTMKALLQVKKSDGYSVANDCEIDVENNTVVATITQQMSVAVGVCVADVSLYNAENNQVLGTMKFNIVTDSNAVTKEDITSSSEFNSLAELIILGKEKIEAIVAYNEQIKTEEQQRQTNEDVREDNEATRQSNEEARKANETERQSNETARQEAETARVSAEEARVSAEDARVLAEQARVAAESLRSEAETARANAESLRVEAEKARVTAENKRQTDTAAAIEDCNEISDELETKLANGDFNGKSVLYGAGIPAKDLGNIGDCYINIANTELYPYYLFTKDGEDWTPRWLMKGQDGSDTLPIEATIRIPKEMEIPSGYEEVPEEVTSLYDNAGDLISEAYMPSPRNILINGDFLCWQRNTEFTKEGYSADMWYFKGNGSTSASCTKVDNGAVIEQTGGTDCILQQYVDKTLLAGKKVTIIAKVSTVTGNVSLSLTTSNAAGSITTTNGEVLVSSDGILKTTLTVPSNSDTFYAVTIKAANKCIVEYIYMWEGSIAYYPVPEDYGTAIMRCRAWIKRMAINYQGYASNVSFTIQNTYPFDVLFAKNPSFTEYAAGQRKSVSSVSATGDIRRLVTSITPSAAGDVSLYNYEVIGSCEPLQ